MYDKYSAGTYSMSKYFGLTFSYPQIKLFNTISLNVPQDKLMVVVVYAGLIISQCNTGCRVFTWGLQNLKEFSLRINITTVAIPKIISVKNARVRGFNDFILKKIKEN
jgi:hypothetical protein